MEKYMSFNINSSLVFSSSLDSLVKILVKNDFKRFCQEFDSNVLDLVKQKGFYP